MAELKEQEATSEQTQYTVLHQYDAAEDHDAQMEKIAHLVWALKIPENQS